jgi:hypothetical protein
MPESLRIAALASLLLLLGVSTAPAQTFSLLANESDLTPSSGNTDIQCLHQLGADTFVFFNSSDSGIYTWDGSTLTAHTDSTTLNSNIDATTNPINRCDAVEVSDGFVYFSLRASSDDNQPNYIYRTEAADAQNNTFIELDGTLGLAARNSTLYLASYAFFDDTDTREDGIYSINADLSGSPTEVATNPDLSIDGGIDISGSGVLYGYSNDFGSGDFEATIVSLDLTASSPSFQVFSDPYASGSPLNGSDAIGDVNTLTFSGTEYVVVHNENSGAPNGEEFAAIRVSDQEVSLLFTANDLIDNLSVTDFSGAFARAIDVSADGTVYVASGGGGPNYLASVSGASPLPVEMTAFEAVRDGRDVTLAWTTASETNNAGFRVQHQPSSAEAWTQIGFVESGADGGTTTEAQSYRFDVAQDLAPGTHRFRLTQVDLDGTTHQSEAVSVTVGLDGALQLTAPAPNPASGPATLSFATQEAQPTTVALYNVLGQKVATLYRGTPTAGQSTTVQVATGDLPSGLYIVRVQSGAEVRTQRLTVVR